jgi:hypothetical protein
MRSIITCMTQILVYTIDLFRSDRKPAGNGGRHLPWSLEYLPPCWGSCSPPRPLSSPGWWPGTIIPRTTRPRGPTWRVPAGRQRKSSKPTAADRPHRTVTRMRASYALTVVERDHLDLRPCLLLSSVSAAHPRQGRPPRRSRRPAPRRRMAPRRCGRRLACLDSRGRLQAAGLPGQPARGAARLPGPPRRFPGRRRPHERDDARLAPGRDR